MSKWSLCFDCPICGCKVCLSSSLDTHEHKGIRYSIREVNLPDGMTSRILVRSMGEEEHEELAIRAPTAGLRRAGL